MIAKLETQIHFFPDGSKADNALTGMARVELLVLENPPAIQ